MAKPTRVRLYPLLEEHTLPMLVDVLVWIAVYGVLLIPVGLPEMAAGGVAVAVALLVHVVQMAFLVAVEFDDTGVTVVRPWRRRRVEWTEVGGLIFAVQYGRHTLYRLRLVLKDNQPPVGRYLTEADLRPYATGPVIMTLYNLGREPGSDTRSARCRSRLGAELARHGFPVPEPLPWAYRTPEYTEEEATHAAAIDLMGLRPVTITHGELAGEAAALVATTLPELARGHGAQTDTVHNDASTTFLFDGPDADEHAAAFRAAAEDLVPDTWSVDASALPAVEPGAEA